MVVTCPDEPQGVRAVLHATGLSVESGANGVGRALRHGHHGGVPDFDIRICSGERQELLRRVPAAQTP